ncbi:uncharacterized protein [Palaemon carinicauda]|uniref:uncharacterized protein n=1 Tax=Palaemon carinicauda TaxID=392227 RepID=UPI0035B5D847
MCLFWPGINRDIEQLVNQCQQCQTFQALQPKEPMEAITPNLPNQPWHTLGMELFTVNDRNYVIITDYYSKFPVIHQLSVDSTSRTVAQLTSSTFSLFGILYPVRLSPIMARSLSDNPSKICSNRTTLRI